MDRQEIGIAEAWAFLGNSLMEPPTRTSACGLRPDFWDGFPTFGDAGVREAARSLSAWAQSRSADGRAMDEAAWEGRAAALEELALSVAVEHTRLFVGPPSPLAPPWETMYRRPSSAGGALAAGAAPSTAFGEATFAMRRFLREEGLVLSNENRQYEDHMGIELLCLSKLCARKADDGRIAAFLDERPLSWIVPFREKVEQAAPDGYYARLLRLAEELLRCQRGRLSA